MKKTLFLFALVTGFTLGLSAQKVQIGDLYYYLNDNNGTASVTWDKFGEKTNYQGHATIIIPGDVSYDGKNYRVNEIGTYAFNSCQMTSVVLPDNIETIAKSAFEKCKNLSSIGWGQAGKLKEIAQNAFSNSGLTTLALPDGVKTIWNSFNYCSRLQVVTIPASLEEIKAPCFIGCDSLTAIHVDAANLNYCAEDGLLFDKQKNILLAYPLACQNKRFILPESVTKIGDLVFYEAGEYPQTVILHAGVTNIGYQSFFFSQLDTLISYSVVPPTIDTETFKECYAVMYAPDESYMDYRTAWHEWVYPLSALAEGVETVQTSSSAIRKEVLNGHVIIRRDDKLYTLDGKEIK